MRIKIEVGRVTNPPLPELQRLFQMDHLMPIPLLYSRVRCMG